MKSSSSTKFKLFVAEAVDFSSAVKNQLSSHFDLEVCTGPLPTKKELLSSYDALWFRFGLRFSADNLTTTNSIRTKVFVTPVTGPNHIDVEAASRCGIEILSLKGETEFLKNVRATSELCIGLILSLLRHIPRAAERTRNGEWQRDFFRGHEIYEKKVGIVGVGRLGSQVAQVMHSMGAKVLGHDSNPNRNFSFIEWMGLRDIFEQADIISLHLPLNNETNGLISSELLKLMKRAAFLVNTARGELLDESFLVQMIRQKKLAGAALDVICNEDDVGPHRDIIQAAKEMPQLILTPHIGGNTYESFQKTEAFMAEKLIRFFKL